MKQKAVSASLLLIGLVLIGFRVHHRYVLSQIEDAIWRGDVKTVNALVGSKDFTRAKGSDGKPLVCSALMSPRPDAGLKLFHSAADLAQCDPPGRLLTYAVGNGSDELAWKLLACLCGTQGSPMFMEEALFAALYGRKIALVKALLEEKVSPNAKRGGYNAIAASLPPPTPNAPQAVHKQMLELLLRYGADVNAGNHNGKTALHFAALAGQNEFVRILVKHGADINAPCPGEANSTPLMQAVIGKRTETVRLLLQLGADPTRRTAVGASFSFNSVSFSNADALTQAIYSRNPEIVKILLEAQGNKGRSPQTRLAHANRLPASREKNEILALLRTAQK